MPDEEVHIKVRAETEGEEVYGRHVEGMERVSEASETTGRTIERNTGKFEGARSALSGLNLTLLSVERGMRFFGVSNDFVSHAIDGLVTVLTLARSALAIYKAVTESVTLANWARSASEVAATGPAAPIVAGIVIAAIAALAAYSLFGKTTTASSGFEGVVTGPRMFLAGEAGPERVHIAPVTGLGTGGLGPIYVTNNIYTNDPEAAARAVTDQLIRLRGAGR